MTSEKRTIPQVLGQFTLLSSKAQLRAASPEAEQRSRSSIQRFKQVTGQFNSSQRRRPSGLGRIVAAVLCRGREPIEAQEQRTSDADLFSTISDPDAAPSLKRQIGLKVPRGKATS